MKRTPVGFLGFGCIMALAASSGIPLFGQSPNQYGQNRNYLGNNSAYQTLPNPQYVQPISQQPQILTVPNGGMYGQRLGDQKHEEGRQALREAQSKLRAPETSESDKKEARTAIEKFLEDEFERDQKMRREQVTRLEEQVSKLRKQLDKRDESKRKIIELRMQLMENDAEGLSFPESFNELQRSNVPQTYSPVGQVPSNSPQQWALYGQSIISNDSLNKGIGTPNPPIPPNMNRPPEAKRP